MASTGVKFVCTSCKAASPPRLAPHACALCAAPLALHNATKPAFPRELIKQRPPTMWRYREAIPIDGDPVTLGEGMSPLIPFALASSGTSAGGAQALNVLLKLEGVMPTGSYKDRGGSALVSWIAATARQPENSGKSFVAIEDSSGNAGASVSAYCARAGIRCDIYTPESASAGKRAQIAMSGAVLRGIPGPRAEATAAALKAVDASATAESVSNGEAKTTRFYASHNWNPFFMEGVKTAAFEIWEQLGFAAPDVVVCPCGFGGLFLALHMGFAELKDAGEIERVPRMYGVQAEHCAPLAAAYGAGKGETDASFVPTATVAEGIACARPIRAKDVMQAARESGGGFAVVPESSIFPALGELARGGVYAEPTSAVIVEGLRRLHARGDVRRGETVVAIVTGSGLKATDKIVAHMAQSG